MTKKKKRELICKAIKLNIHNFAEDKDIKTKITNALYLLSKDRLDEAMQEIDADTTLGWIDVWG